MQSNYNGHYNEYQLSEKEAEVLCQLAGVNFEKPTGMVWNGMGWSSVSGDPHACVSLPMGALDKLERLSSDDYSAIQAAG